MKALITLEIIDFKTNKNIKYTCPYLCIILFSALGRFKYTFELFKYYCHRHNDQQYMKAL